LRKNPLNFAITRDLQNENMKYMYMAYILWSCMMMHIHVNKIS
jgi:hypothetical protein